VVFGTTNSDNDLKDATGNRRFWPVKVQRFDIKGLAAVRDQLWAEAAEREASGESIRLHPSLYGVAAEEQDARQVRDPWLELLEPLFRDNDRVTNDQIWQALELTKDRLSPSDAYRVAAIAQRLGFSRRSVKDNGKPVRGWVRAEKVDGENTKVDGR
jgi:predicted P-loop ATPase